MGTAKHAKEVWITFKGKQRQVKPRGIREPKDRVKGYRVEIRPPSSKAKIWVGTFETRHKAQRAFDAAVFLIGKEPYYHLYPGNYFPKRPSSSSNARSSNNFQKLKMLVQKEAKKFAEKSDHLPVNPSSLMVESPTRHQAIPEVIEEDLVQELDDPEPMEDVYYQEPVQDISEQEPAVEVVNEQEPGQPDMDEQELVEDMVPAAYLRGLKAADPGVVNALLDYPPPESFTVFSYIQGDESILDLFEEDPASRLIPSPESESHDQFDGGNWLGFAVDGEGGLGGHPMEEPWWSA